jgi:hypothetical protein
MKTVFLAASFAIASFAVACGGVVSSAHAASDGALVGLHELRREGNKTCMADHFHNGSTYGARTRSQAEALALRNWSEFTAMEYGGHWGSPSLASSKTMKCALGASGWNCDFDARPCKR